MTAVCSELIMPLLLFELPDALGELAPRLQIARPPGRRTCDAKWCADILRLCSKGGGATPCPRQTVLLDCAVEPDRGSTRLEEVERRADHCEEVGGPGCTLFATRSYDKQAQPSQTLDVVGERLECRYRVVENSFLAGRADIDAPRSDGSAEAPDQSTSRLSHISKCDELARGRNEGDNEEQTGDTPSVIFLSRLRKSKKVDAQPQGELGRSLGQKGCEKSVTEGHGNDGPRGVHSPRDSRALRECRLRERGGDALLPGRAERRRQLAAYGGADKRLTLTAIDPRLGGRETWSVAIAVACLRPAPRAFKLHASRLRVEPIVDGWAT